MPYTGNYFVSSISLYYSFSVRAVSCGVCSAYTANISIVWNAAYLIYEHWTVRKYSAIVILVLNARTGQHLRIIIIEKHGHKIYKYKMWNNKRNLFLFIFKTAKHFNSSTEWKWIKRQIIAHSFSSKKTIPWTLQKIHF